MINLIWLSKIKSKIAIEMNMVFGLNISKFFTTPSFLVEVMFTYAYPMQATYNLESGSMYMRWYYPLFLRKEEVGI